jgi:biopolymer transport protein TolQ
MVKKIVCGNTLWNIVTQSDAVTKLILLFLLAMSIFCWTIFFYKIILLRKKREHMRVMRKVMKGVTTFEQLIDVTAKQAGTLPGYFLTSNLSFLKSLLVTTTGEPKKQISSPELELIRQHADQTVEDMVHAENSYLPVLFTSASVSPLIGLFGTVWGLIHSFVRISERQSADIATVAPGIAEALITTLAGLVVAIPAVMLYYYCATQVKKVERQLYGLADQFVVLAQQLSK